MASIAASTMMPRASARAAPVQRSNGARPSLARATPRMVQKAALRSAVVSKATTEEAAMRQAQEKWQDNIRQGKVRNVSAKDIKGMIQDGWTVLDVRPPEEIERVGLVGAVEVPLFEVDDGLDPAALLKQMSAFGMGGWWLGGSHMKANTQFLAQVQAKVPKDAKVLVTCQKGLRSLAACEQLSKAGYQQLAWINGGLDTVRQGMVNTTVDKDLRYAGIGGLSSVVGWTEVQQEEKTGMGFENILKAAAVLIVADLLVFAYEQYQYMTSQ